MNRRTKSVAAVLAAVCGLACAPGALGQWQFNGSGIYYNDGFVGVGRSYIISSAEVFGVRAAGSGYGGMFMETTGATGLPFYGYATNGSVRAWSYLDGGSGTWNLYNSGDRLSVTNTGRAGIGTTAPQSQLHVVSGFAGNVTTNGNSIATFERGNHGYLSVLTPSSTERGILFGDETSNVHGGIIYNSGNTNGLQLRTGGNAVRMLIDNQGNVGVGGGTLAPAARLDVRANTGSTLPVAIRGLSTFGGRDSAGVQGISNAGNGNGLIGDAHAGGAAFGVWGKSFSGYAGWFDGHTQVVGTLHVSGGKFFRIDHPDDPENKYLQHFCAESDEPINFYRGTVTLNGGGEALVELPGYFGKVNTNPTYQLTAVGAPMPLLHVAERISETDLAAGAEARPDVPAPVCWFRIAGGVPGGEVSWRVEATRNDAWMRDHGAPVEVEKQGLEKGRYLYPAGFGKPDTMSVRYAKEHPELAAQPDR